MHPCCGCLEGVKEGKDIVGDTESPAESVVELTGATQMGSLGSGHRLNVVAQFSHFVHRKVNTGKKAVSAQKFPPQQLLLSAAQLVPSGKQVLAWGIRTGFKLTTSLKSRTILRVLESICERLLSSKKRENFTTSRMTVGKFDSRSIPSVKKKKNKYNILHENIGWAGVDI